MNQFSNTQRSITTVGYDELPRTPVSINLSLILFLHLAETKYILSPVAAVWVSLVVSWRCWQGRGRIDICGIGKG